MFRYHYVFITLAFATLASAQNADVTSSTPNAEVFQDWQLSCAADADDGQDVCQLSQAAAVDGTDGSVFLLTISAGEDGRNSYAVITVPLGVYLAPGVELRVDNRRPFRVLYEICDAQDCYAGFEMSDQVLSAFRRGLDARFRVWVGREQAVEFPVSLRGFSAAWRAYGEAL